jgi:hypothetical protein
MRRQLHSVTTATILAAGFAILAAGCAILATGCLGPTPNPETCRIEIVGVESAVNSGRGFDISYRVKGYAGTPAIVSLVAQRHDGGYLSGKGVEVGPGEFVAIVDQKLTAPAAGYVALLEVADGRCRANAKAPEV